ncbi:MAG: hypothetical protein IVW54_16645 [Candidatus Binataceae bacterium]|nr:hypothetical protein [Candidatus Binataceae bacterium]
MMAGQTIETTGAMATNRWNNFVSVPKVTVQNWGDSIMITSEYKGGSRCNAIALRPDDARALIAAIQAELAV